MLDNFQQKNKVQEKIIFQQFSFTLLFKFL